MFFITEEITKETGYLNLGIIGKLDDSDEIQMVQMELFGRAIKFSSFDIDTMVITNVENVFNHLAITLEIQFSQNGQSILLLQDDTKLAMKDEQLEILKHYLEVTENNSSYFGQYYGDLLLSGVQLPQLPNNFTDINDLSGIEFEQLIQHLVEKMGFEVSPTKASLILTIVFNSCIDFSF